jgi:ATP-dependent DNA helicase RecG
MQDSLSMPIKYLKGIGPKRSELLNSIEILDIEDLLFYLPKKWEDRRLIDEKLPDYVDKKDILIGEILKANEVYTSSSLRIFNLILNCEGKQILVQFFKKYSRNYDVFSSIKKELKIGEKAFFIGRYESVFLKDKFRAEEYYLLNSLNSMHYGRIIPVYQLTEGLNQKLIRQSVWKAIIDYSSHLADLLPQKFKDKRNILNIKDAVSKIHYPESLSDLEKARKRFIYQEFFLMSIAWAIKRRQTLNIRKNFKYEIKKKLLTPFKENLGFEFTRAQKKVINEIFSDMLSSHPMSRLIQGDVGCGKTVVALSACLLSVENGYQCAFMAPTEILAEQHFITFAKFLKGLPVKYELLTSSINKNKRKEILKRVRDGEIDILIGTHALIEKDLEFKKLALVIIDEQHRFGVRQRSALRQKGEQVDMLIMTATPIPRTLALSLYGDLDLSIINELPDGRLPVKTLHISREEAFKKVKEQVSLKQQAYIVYPIIEESKLEVKSLKNEYEKLKDIFLPFKTGILHGKMKTKEKQKIMQSFVNKEIDILFSTQVVEVGIDVPSATVMVIENAERFGLSSLHQLRGRIGRAGKQSYCYLISETNSQESLERIKIMCEVNSGFELSEKDAYIRGLGEILGLKQHGDMDFEIADIYRDKKIFYEAMEDARELIKEDPYLNKYPLIKDRIFKLYNDKWKLIDLN